MRGIGSVLSQWLGFFAFVFAPDAIKGVIRQRDG